MTESKLLEDELRGIDGLIETAAVDEDFVEWSRLAMRRDALPALLREARSRPLKAEIRRLEDELAGLDEELLQAREGPPPEVPEGARDRITQEMAKNARIGGISAELGRVGGRLKEKRRELEEIEREGVRPLY